MSPYEWKAARRAEAWSRIGWILAATFAVLWIVELLTRGAR